MQFSHYHPEEASTRKRAQQLVTDNRGRIWAAYNTGLCPLYSSGKPIYFPAYRNPLAVRPYFVHALADSTFLVAYTDRHCYDPFSCHLLALDVFDPRTRTFRPALPDSSALFSQKLLAVIPTRGDTCQLVTATGEVGLWVPGTGLRGAYQLPPAVTPLNSARLPSVLHSFSPQKGMVYTTPEGLLSFYHPGTQQVRTFTEWDATAEQYAVCPMLDPPGQNALWLYRLAARQQVLLFAQVSLIDGRTIRRFEVFLPDYIEEPVTALTQIKPFISAQHQQILVTSPYNMDVFSFDWAGRPVQQWISPRRESILDNNDLLLTERTLFFAGARGVFSYFKPTEIARPLPRTDVLKLRDHRFIVVQNDTLWTGNNEGLWFAEKKSPDTYGVLKLWPTSPRHLLAGVHDPFANQLIFSAENQLFTRQSGQARVQPLPSLREELQHKIWHILPTEQHLWLATENGQIVRHHRRTGHNQVILPAGKEGHQRGTFYGIHATPESWLVYGEDGLFQLDTASLLLTPYVLQASSGRPATVVYHLLPKGDNILWLGTDRGLLRLDTTTGQLRNIFAEQGLPPEEVLAVYAQDSVWWLPSSNGLYHYRPASRTLCRFKKEYGLDPEFNRNAHFQSSDGGLYLGTITELYQINSANSATLPYWLPPEFTLNVRHGIRQEASYQSHALPRDGPLIIRGSDAQLTLQLRQPSPLPGKARFQYRMGPGTPWQALPGNTLYLSNLATGHHRLEVRSYLLGVPSRPTAVHLDVRLNQAQFLLSAFQVLGAVGVLFSLWLWGRYQQNKRVQKRLTSLVAQRTSDLEKEKQAAVLAGKKIEKLQAFKEDMYRRLVVEARNPMTLTLAPIELIQAQQQDRLPMEVQQALATVHQNTRRLNQLMNDLTAILEDLPTTPALRPERVDMPGLLSDLWYCSYFLAKATGIPFTPGNRLPTSLATVQTNEAAVWRTYMSAVQRMLLHLRTGDTLQAHLSAVEDDAPTWQLTFTLTALLTPARAIAPDLSALLQHLAPLQGQAALHTPADDRCELSFSFPVRRAEAPSYPSASGRPAAKSRATASAPTPHVVLIDTHQEASRLLQNALLETFKVSRYATPTAFWAARTTGKLPLPVHIVLSETDFPKESGLDFLRRLRGKADFRQTSVVFYTAAPFSDTRKKAYQYGADDYLEKPYPHELLRARLEGMVALHHKIRPAAAAKQPASMDHADEKEQIVSLLQQHLHRKELDNTWLAEQLHLSERQLYRKTQALFEQTPHKLIRTFRLEQALYLLTNHPDLPVSAVAERVGMEGGSYFSRLFRRHFGMSPSDIRKPLP